MGGGGDGVGWGEGGGVRRREGCLPDRSHDRGVTIFILYEELLLCEASTAYLDRLGMVSDGAHEAHRASIRV